MVLLYMQAYVHLEYECCFINSQGNQGINNLNLLTEILTPLNLMEFLLFTSLGSEF